jgi:hypothetical protein
MVMGLSLAREGLARVRTKAVPQRRPAASFSNAFSWMLPFLITRAFEEILGKYSHAVVSLSEKYGIHRWPLCIW